MNKVFVFAILLGVAGCSSVTPSQEKFELKLVPISANSETRHIKFNRLTGETWWSSNTNWLKVQEPEPIPKSIYDIQFVATSDSWRAIRIDKVSGKTWKNSFGKWVPFTEQVSQ